MSETAARTDSRLKVATIVGNDPRLSSSAGVIANLIFIQITS